MVCNFLIRGQLYYLCLGLPNTKTCRLCVNFLCFIYLVLTFFMAVGFVGVGRDLVFLQNLNKHFGCLGEQIYKKICLLLIASGGKSPQYCHDLRRLSQGQS